MLPFEPELREKLEARFSLAFTPKFDVARCVDRTGPFPGTQRRHVFDFENGVRMIVSVDTDGETDMLHFSFGMSSGCLLSGEQFGDFLDEVIKEFWKPDYKVDARMNTAKALHVFCPLD